MYVAVCVLLGRVRDPRYRNLPHRGSALFAVQTRHVPIHAGTGGRRDCTQQPIAEILGESGGLLHIDMRNRRTIPEPLQQPKAATAIADEVADFGHDGVNLRPHFCGCDLFRYDRVLCGEPLACGDQTLSPVSYVAVGAGA